MLSLFLVTCLVITTGVPRAECSEVVPSGSSQMRMIKKSVNFSDSSSSSNASTNNGNDTSRTSESRNNKELESSESHSFLRHMSPFQPLPSPLPIVRNQGQRPEPPLYPLGLMQPYYGSTPSPLGISHPLFEPPPPPTLEGPPLPFDSLLTPLGPPLPPMGPSPPMTNPKSHHMNVNSKKVQENEKLWEMKSKSKERNKKEMYVTGKLDESEKEVKIIEDGTGLELMKSNRMKQKLGENSEISANMKSQTGLNKASNMANEHKSKTKYDSEESVASDIYTKRSQSINPSHQFSISRDWLDGKGIEDMALMMKTDLAVTSTPSVPKVLDPSRNASASVPLLVITTPAPLLQKETRKKVTIESTFNPSEYLYPHMDIHHQPLHTMHGPPYDHYKLPSHRFIAGSFMTSVPLKQRERRMFLESYSRRHSLETPKMSSPRPQLSYVYPSTPKPSLSLLPYFSEDFPSTTSVSKKTETYKKPVKQHKKITKALTYKINDPFFRPYSDFPAHKTPQKKKSLQKIHNKPKQTYSEPANDYLPTVSKGVSGGVPGVDYPAYARIPYTSFTCHGRHPGIYGDMEAGCQVWHICERDSRQHSFLCPNGTIFNQQLLTCDWWYNVYCDDTVKFYDRIPSIDIYKPHSNALPKRRKKIIKKGKVTPISSYESPRKHISSYAHSTTKTPKKLSHHPSTKGPPTHLGGHPHPHASPHDVKISTPVPLVLHPVSPRPSLPPNFVEFEPYHLDSYPMFHLNKRNVFLAV